MHIVKQTNKKDIKNENRQKKRSRQILQRPPEDAHCAKAHDGGNMERNQRHPISGVRSFGPGRQGRAAGQGSVRSIQKYKISLSGIRGHWPRIFFMISGATNCRRDKKPQAGEPQAASHKQPQAAAK